MPRKKPRERPYKEFAENPFVAAAAFGISVAIVGLSYAAMTATPERRRELKERMAAERRYRRKVKEQVELGHRLRKEFSEGEGKAAYEREAYIVIPSRPPWPDARFEIRDGGRGFTASSESAGLRLSLSHDFRDAMTSVNMIWPGADDHYALGGISDGALMIYPADLTDPARFETWIEGAERMARLISAPGSRVGSIRLRRPDHAEIERRMWEEHLRLNPDVAAATGEEWRIRRRWP